MFHALWKHSWSVEIVNHLWQSTLVVLVASMLALALNRYQARVRYWVWMSASVKFLVPFSLLAATGRLLHSIGTPAIAASPLTSAVAKVEQPFGGFVRPSNSFSLSLPEQVSAAHAQLAQHWLSASQVLFAIWLAGVFFLVFRWSRSWLDLRAVVRQASPRSSSMTATMLVTSRHLEPGVFGLFRPRLLVPSHLVERLPEDQLRAVVAHELCHIQRRDNLTGAIHMVVEMVFWFHPAVWWMERRLIEERERACDEAVLQLGNDAQIYAESILNVSKFCIESALVCMSGVTGSELKQRMLRIMAKKPVTRLDGRCKLLLGVAAGAIFSLPIVSGLLHSTEARAQSEPSGATQRIVGTWQGTLHTDRDYRFVLKITAAGAGGIKSTFYNVTGQPGGVPGFSTAFNGSLLKVDLGFAAYEGTLTPGGTSVIGKWRQGVEAQPLVFVRATPATEWSIPQPPPPPTPMAADASPEFEVSTIKPSAPEERGPRYMFTHRRFSVVHVTLDQLVQFAYGVQAREVENGPDWFRTEAFDMVGQPGGEGEPSIQQWQAMVKKLMADRFRLKIRDDKREMSVYALTLAKGGPKFAKSQGDPDGKPGLGFGPGNMGATNATMAEIAEAMQQGAVDRPVVDQTGLVGRFDLRMRWTPAEMLAGSQSADAPPDLFTAMQEQLGLRLVAARAPVGVIVIVQVEHPSAN